MAEEDKITKSETETCEEDVETLKKALAAEKTKAEGYLAGWQRAQADFINFKRRSEQEKEETITYANTNLILKLLSALDDLELAFANIPQELTGSWIDGVKLIERKLMAMLEEEGLEPIKAVGESFDPYLHEALRRVNGKDGVVIEEMQKGYKFRDKVIRPSKVAVGSGEEAEEPKEKKEA